MSFRTLSLGLIILAPQLVLAHCEVPCGIYGDELRFKQMLEDQETIAKAVEGVNQLAGEGDALSVNQATRWVVTKEDHATKIQHVIAQYFMTQRLKPGTEGYTEKLTAAHAVMVAAMKSKQTADAATAAALRKSILDFYRAYEGKEPELGHAHGKAEAQVSSAKWSLGSHVRVVEK